jgi:branched-chain amino acid transport system permease protein
MGDFYGYSLYLISLLTMGGIYAIVTLGLNVQWGSAGLFNSGIAGFFAIGAYTTAILTTAPDDTHLGGYEVPYLLSFIAAMALSGAVAWVIGKICLRLRSDYLAIATIGVAEIFRLVLRTEAWATNGPRGIAEIPRPFGSLPEPWNQVAFLALVLAILALLYCVLEIVQRSPWGRVINAVRDNEAAARAAGKNVARLRLQAFVIGCMIMALGGGLTANYLRFVDPNLIDPFLATFIVWVMLIVGGSGNNAGAILGAFLIWGLWSMSELLTGLLPDMLAVRVSYVRIFIIGLALQICIQRYAAGILPPRKAASRQKL